MEKILKHLTLNSVLMILSVVLLVCVELTALDIRRVAYQNSSGIERARAAAAALAQHNERVMLDFMARTVARWDALQKNNPDIKVPRVEEPLDTPTLNQEDLKRP